MNMQTSTDRNLNFDFVRRQVEQPPAWASEVLLSWEEAYPPEKHAFLQSHYWTETGSINVFRVVGTDHWDYQGRSWLDFLTGGKRMQRNLQALLDNPSYYLQPTERRPAIHYNTLDGLSFYVGSDGNHRTCIARFFLAEQQKSQLHDVTLNHYQVNDSFYRLYGQLRQQLLLQGLPVQIHPERVQLGREDTAGWKMDTYQTTLNWLNLKTQEERSLNEAQARAQLIDLMRGKPSEEQPRGWKARLKCLISG
ncbi:hypothetical protein ACFZN0_23575 [Pseudomonas aeruginosa]